MGKIFNILLIFFLLCGVAYTQPTSSRTAITDGTTTVYPYEITFPSITDDGDGTATINAVFPSGLDICGGLAVDGICARGSISVVNDLYIGRNLSITGGIISDIGICGDLTVSGALNVFNNDFRVTDSLLGNSLYFDTSAGDLTIQGIMTSASASFTGGSSRVTGTYSEYIDFGTDDFIGFVGANGTDDTDLRIDLDGGHPVIDSSTDDVIGFADGIWVCGDSRISRLTVIGALDAQGICTRENISVGNELYVKEKAYIGNTTTSNKINLGGGLTAFVLNGVSLDAVVGSTSQISTELQYIGIQHTNAAAAGSRFMFARSRGTLATPTIVQNGNSLAAIDVAGYDGTDYVLAAQIDFEVDGTPGGNDMPGRILFKTTADGGILPAERFRIDNIGVSTFTVNGTETFTIGANGFCTPKNGSIAGNLYVGGDTVFSADIYWAGAGSGAPRGCLKGTDETVTCTNQNQWYQVTFDTIGSYNLTTPSSDNNDITIIKAGEYTAIPTINFHSAVAHDFELMVKKNNGTVDLEPYLLQSTSVANQVENISGSCFITVSADDTVELWVRCTDAAGINAIFDIVSLNIEMVGG